MRTLEVDASGRLAMLTLTDAALAASGAAADETDGLISLPLGTGHSGGVLQNRRRPLAREPAVEGRHRRQRGP
jgi:hypothetical protein